VTSQVVLIETRDIAAFAAAQAAALGGDGVTRAHHGTSQGR
jgi:hypothetical protein